MTDNRTTDLRKKLTEHGVDWVDEDNDYADVTTFIANDIKWTVISKSYLNPEHDWMTLRAERITTEQAVAAMLRGGTCNITATATSNLMYPDHMTKWYELSCGHSLTLKGDEAPKWCAVCGKAVKR